MTIRHPLIVVSLTTVAASACDFCAITSAIDARETRPGAILGMEEQFTSFGTIRSGTSAVDDPARQHMESSITLATVGWRFTEWLGVEAIVPYIHRDFRRADGFATDRGTEQGIGDVSLVAIVTPLHRIGARTGLVLSLIAGVKTPTGDDARLAEEANEVAVPGAPESGYHGHDLALGTGSWDGVVGASGLLRYDRAFLAGDLQYLLRTEGGHHYRMGNDLTGSVGPGVFLWLAERGSVSLEARLAGEHKVEDVADGATAGDTAADALYLGPLLTATFGQRATASAGVEWPLYQHVTGVQGVPDWRARIGVSGRF